tara:strand:- start:13476 stop:14231 length:756 start_codon:yes stop_codon:yes gene_type:complete
MTIIASINGATRRIYLHPDTVGASLHPVDLYKEYRTLRRLDETLRVWSPLLSYTGNVPKSAGTGTERYMTLLSGARIVPFGTSHSLTIVGTIITDTGQEGIVCFDRSSLSSGVDVDINYVPPQVEVITVSVGSGLDAAQSTLLTNIALDTNELQTNQGDWVTVSATTPRVFTLTGLVAGSTVRLYETDGLGGLGTELSSTVNSGVTFEYTHTSNTNDLLLQVIAVGFVETITSITLGNTSSHVLEHTYVPV